MREVENVIFESLHALHFSDPVPLIALIVALSTPLQRPLDAELGPYGAESAHHVSYSPTGSCSLSNNDRDIFKLDYDDQPAGCGGGLILLPKRLTSLRISPFVVLELISRNLALITISKFMT